jgi:hypothetical protein
MSAAGFDEAIAGYRQALHAYVTGDPAPVSAFFSRRADVTLANPLGPPRVGPGDVDEAIAAGAANLRDGRVRGFEEVARYCTPQLGYVVQIERTEAGFLAMRDGAVCSTGHDDLPTRRRHLEGRAPAR